MTSRSISSECCSIFKVHLRCLPVGDSFVILPFSPHKVNSFFAFFEKKVQKICAPPERRAQSTISCFNLPARLQNGRCQACEQVGKAGGKKETGQNHERKQSRNHFGEPECQTVGGERSGLRRKAQQKQTQDRKGSEKEKEKQLSAH